MVSKVGKVPITLPAGVTAEVNQQSVLIKGPKGELSFTVPQGVKVEQKENILIVILEDPSQNGSLQGLTRTLLSNAVHGVSEGWTKTLELIGTGYRVSLEGPNLSLSLGFSHLIKFPAPQGISFAVDQNKIDVKGADRNLVGLAAAKIRDFRPPEPYKGKGVKYLDEKVRRKAGKAAKAVGATTK